MKPFEIFYKTIKEYNFKSKTQKQTGSMVELLYPNSLQSFCIKVGNCIELCFKNYIKSKQLLLSEKISINGIERQADLYFKYNNKKYYFEIKNNVNLDTEKTKEVKEKLDLAKTDVKGVLTFRFDKKENCFIKKTFYNYIFGYNDFFSIFNENLTKEEFNSIIALLRNKFEE